MPYIHPGNPTCLLRRRGTAVLDVSVIEGFGFEIGL